MRQHSNSNCDRSGHTRLLAQVLQNHHPWTILTYMISCCLPFRFIRETAAACDRRFCSSSVSRTRRCDSCSKSLNVTNLEMQLIKRKSLQTRFKPNCGHLWHFRSAKIIQNSYQVLPNSNSCLGEPGLKFFGFTCTALTLLVRTRLSGKPGVFCSSKGRKCENTLNAQNDKATRYIADI